MAHNTGDMERITVDTTVPPKHETHPSDAMLILAATRQLTEVAQGYGVRLSRSYARVAKRAAMMAGRYALSKHFGAWLGADVNQSVEARPHKAELALAALTTMSLNQRTTV